MSRLSPGAIRQGWESRALLGHGAALAYDDCGGFVGIGRGFPSVATGDSGCHVASEVRVSRARGITDDHDRLGGHVLIVLPRADPASLGTAADQIFGRQMAHALDDLIR